ncbi:MAG: GAF domain-containing protein [Candidatus Omnitrophica bacterium]|nr:GAF domain-containing protein [Candidatus Omnitrophota bacterium]
MAAGQSAAQHLSLSELVEPQRWQQLQDHFAAVLGVALRTIGPSHELLSAPSWPPGLHAESVIQLLKVGGELEPLVPLSDPPHETSSVTTALGVTYAAVPIHVTPDQIIAYLIVGPLVVGPREDRLQFRQRLSASGEDTGAIWSLILTLKPYTFSGIHSLLNLLEAVGTSLVQFAYQAHRLAAILPATGPVDEAVASYHTDRLLAALLEVATVVTRAEGGSVMLYDRKDDALRIRAAQGLSDAVVVETRQKRAEGLAGLAAARRDVLLVDNQTAEPAVTELMRRRDLASSLIAPLTLEAEPEPVGILSLRTADRERRFTPEHAEMVRRLLDLTGIALSNLRKR